MATKNTKKGTKKIVLALERKTYLRFMSDSDYAKDVIKDQYKLNPELFPEVEEFKFCLNGFSRESKKQSVRLRKIKVGGSTYQIRPGWLLSYMRGTTDKTK